MISPDDIERALIGAAAFARCMLGDSPIAIRRLTEPERDRELALAVMSIGPAATPDEAHRAQLRRLIWRAVYDIETIHSGAPERFFRTPDEVAELDEVALAQLGDLVATHQRQSLDFGADPTAQARAEREFATSIESWGAIGRLRAEHAAELVAFYGVRSALLDLTDEQVLVWWKLRTLELSPRVEAPPQPSARDRRPMGRTGARRP